MIDTLLQARQVLDFVGHPYTISAVMPEEEAAVRAKLLVPDGVERLGYIMVPRPIPDRGDCVVVFDHEQRNAGTWWSRPNIFVLATRRARFFDMDIKL